MRRCLMYVIVGASAGGAPTLKWVASLANPLRKEGRSSSEYGAPMRNAAALAPIAASAHDNRECFARGVIKQARSGISSAMPPLYLVAAASPAAAPAQAN